MRHFLGCVLGAMFVFVGTACRTSTAARGRPTPPEIGWSDDDNDGIPDRLELRSFADRESFRAWFTAIAELQFYHPSEAWNPDQRDCAGLVRFSWREALRRHDRAWFRRMGAAYESVAPDVAADSLGDNPLGEKLFRTKPGSFRETDLTDGTFSDFADARTLKEFNSVFVSRDRRDARPGDLLVFFQPGVQKYPYHLMIFLARAGRLHDDAEDASATDWVVYHTGEAPDGSGTVKMVRLATLDGHPDPRWRPVLGNRNFLGFYRLKILR